MMNLERIRANVEKLHKQAADERDCEDAIILDVAPQIYSGAKQFFKSARVETLDIDPQYNTDHVQDICDFNPNLANRFDVIMCTEVLEHTYYPQQAIANMFAYLKEGGILYGSTPFCLQEHAPAPDLWRFTRDCLKWMFRDWSSVEITPLEGDVANFPAQFTFKVIK